MSADVTPGEPSQAIEGGVGENPARRRPPFVGRALELQQLLSAFEAAARGDGTLIMLAGEPGIGKTALCQELATLVGARNGLALVGHCYPEGSASLPYQPFVQAFGAYARQRDAEALRVDLGASASEVARIVPALRNQLHLELAAPEYPENDRLRLLSAMVEVLGDIGAKHPLLLVLEDLHDADRGTLDLLVYLARHLAGTRLLVVGTYRDVEVDRVHPLAAALAELRRVSQFQRIHLGELSVDEVQRLLASTSQQVVPRTLAEAVHRRSGGNALFTHELLRFLVSERLVEGRDGTLHRVGAESLAGHMPEGLRDVVGKRLSRLSAAANQVLSVASVVGREFQLEILRRVLACPEDELESALEEAVGAVLVEERSVIGATITYRFSHAFFQQMLYAEIMAPRRIRLHQQVAHVLEEVHARRLEEHAAELAEHFGFSSDTTDLAKAVRYGTVAATRASDVFAYGEAARHLERALAVQDLMDPDDKAKRCDLLLALGEALLSTGDAERVIAKVCPDALALADTLSDRSQAFRACKLALDCILMQGAATGVARPEYLSWAEMARGYANPDTIERSLADLLLGGAWSYRGRRYDARLLRLEALALARRLGHLETMGRCAGILILQGAPQHWDERLQLVEECVGWPRERMSGRTLGTMLWYSGRVLLANGERARAEQLWRQVEELAERTHLATVNLLVFRRDVILAILDGHLEDAVALLRRFVDRSDESGRSVSSRQFTLSMLLAPALYLGRSAAWLDAFDEFAELAGQASQAVGFRDARAICLAHLGRAEEARTLLGARLDEIEGDVLDDESPMYSLAWLLEAAVLLGEPRAARALVNRLACVARLAIGEGFYTCPPRHLGDAAALVGDPTAARAYYMQSLDSAGKIRFRPELALTHLRLAELLLKEEDDTARSEALDHLDTAIPELRDMKMQPALERALALSDTYQAPPAQMSIRSAMSDGLTAREREIANLIADTLSNREIADRLVITEGTVEVHVKHILSKLGFRSRSQVAAWMSGQYSETSDGHRA